MGGNSASNAGPNLGGSPAVSGGLSGTVYGGQQPIVGATVTLWAAGTTGTYGAGAASVATATTNATGAFSFNSAGASPCVTGQYLYITSTGGSSGGAGTNQYSALMAALPTPCGTSTATTKVTVNEVSTIASVTALQQFMSISPGGSPAWSIGAPSTNVTGMANAFTQIGNLISVASGTSSATSATSTINSVTYTTTITPDSSKINALANVLSACVNTNGNGTCTNLLSDATPGSSSAPTDTLQVAYELATNSSGLNLPAHGSSQGEPYYLCSTYIVGTPPFQPSSACGSSSYPTDWAIGVSWSTSNGSIVTGTATPYSMAIDGLGNVWTAYSCSSGAGCTDTSSDTDKGPAYVTKFNPQGQVQFAPVTSTTISTGPSFSTYTGATSYSLIASRPFSLAIDTNNNAWYDSFYGANVSSSSQLGVITKIAQGGTSTGYLVAADAPGAISIDGNNNVYQISEPASGRYYLTELEYDSGNYTTFDQGIGKATSIYNGVWTDSLGYAWSGNSTCANPDTLLRAKTSDEESASGTDEVTNSTGCPNWTGAADSNGGAYFANGGLYHLAISGGSASTTAPSVVTEAAGTGTSNGGLDGGAGVAVDGFGNVWVANSSGGGVSEFSYNGTTFTPLSPAGTTSAPVYGFGTSYLAGTKPIDIATDASGNVWVGTQSTKLWYLVGIAGPTVTPISTMLKNSFVGSRPGAQMLVSLSPSLSFSTVVSQSESLTATLTNTGGANVSVGTVSVTGTNSSDFTITGNTCGSTTLNIGANCTITVAFVSSTPGNFSAQLNVASNAVSSPATSTLTATTANAVGLNLDGGGSATPSVPSLTFASMVAGSTSLPQDVVITNSGSVPLTLTVAMTGTGANLFPETTNCGASVAPGASCNVSVRFGPKVAGSYTASLIVTDNAGSGMQTIPVSGAATPFTITLNNSSASGWTIDNGAISFNWNASSGNLTSWVLDGTSDQLVDTTTTSSGQPEGLYMDNTGSFANGSVPTGGTVAASTVACTIVGGTQTGNQTTPCTVATGSTPYIDWSMTIPDTTNSGNAYTFVEHWVVFPNDPGVHTYVELVHSAGDPAGSVGQMQWVFRDSLSTFTNTYSMNAGLGLLGVQDIPQPPVVDTSSSDPGRAVQNAAEDLHGFNNLPTGFTRQFFTKYDYAGYEYLHQGQGVYGQASSGTTYGVWTVFPKQETLVGGPTKQDLFFTNNIDMIEAYSNHENNNLNLATAAGVAYNRLFGPYYIHVNTEGVAYNQNGNQLTTPAQMYSDAISAGAQFAASGQYDNEAQLVAAGYVPTSGRGTVQVQVNGVTGSQYTAWAVLSDPKTNFQFSTNGMQYWADVSQSGSMTFTGVAPGTYRLSVYVLGQWGEYRQDGIVVTANNTTVVPTVNFVPENFAGATGETIFTIGTPDRSSHEFLHGHTSNGNDDREYWGNWNYWMDFAANQGAVVYYATAVGGTPATNNLNLWNYNHWGMFNPGLYAGVFNSSDDTTDGYQAYPGQEYPGVAGLGAEYAIPTYVATLPGASGTNGANTVVPPWQVYFATPANIASYGSGNVELSIAVACAYGSYTVTLNPQGANQQRAWSYTNYSDCNARSGLSGYTQWFVMEFPASALNPTPGGSNEITISMSQTYGSEDDALRLELTNSTSNPSVTGWNDYTYIYGSDANQSTLNNDSVPNP